MKDNFIVGTAGHIDHGKTTLIKALTGHDTDKLKEEKERGISINLGFTALDLANNEKVGIIDVPGHEAFIKNMMAGVVGMDLILLVIAADDGVMPQSIEHAQILNYMGVENAIIVISKKNLVDASMLNLVEEDIRLSFENTTLENAPIIAVDSVSGENIDKLKNLIVNKLSQIKKEDDNKAMRMNIDRSFSLKGVGTIITGTLTEGEISKDREYMIYPSEKFVKVRSIENHDTPIDLAHKGQRVALNLSNISSNEITRGDIIADPNSLIRVENVQCKLNLSKFSDIKIKHWTRVRFFHGSKEVLARAVPLLVKEIKQGDETLVEFRLEEELYVRRDDKFVIRNYSPVKTIGGGVIIDTNNENHTINSTAYVNYLRDKENFDDIDELIDFLKEFKSFDQIKKHMGEDEVNLRESLDKIISNNEIVNIGDNYISKKSLDDMALKIRDILLEFHKDNPLADGMGKQELKQRLDFDLSSKDFESLLKQKSLTRLIMLQRGVVKDKDFAISLDNFKKNIDIIMDKVKKEEPKLIKETGLISKKEDKEVMAYLLKNDLVKIDDLVVRKENLENLIKIAKDEIIKNGSLTAKDFRDLSKLSRNQAIIVLEYMDKKNITKRIDDIRILV